MLKNKLQIQIEVEAIIPVMRTNKQKEETASKISCNYQFINLYHILQFMHNALQNNVFHVLSRPFVELGR